MNIDPLAEQGDQIDKSPYAFAWNNPIALNDPTGMHPDWNEEDLKPSAKNDFFGTTNVGSVTISGVGSFAGGDGGGGGGGGEPNPFLVELAKTCQECLKQSSVGWAIETSEFIGDVKGNYNKGVVDRLDGISNFFSNKLFSGSYWAKSLSDFGNNLISGRTLLSPSTEYQSEIFQSISSMSANDLAYAAGYGTPDFAFGAVGGYVASGANLGLSIPKINIFGARGGYGVFGRNGLKIGNYKMEALYANPNAGRGYGTIFSFKQMKKGGSLFRWDYGPLHKGGAGLHFTLRLYINGKKYGSSAQRTWYPSYNKVQ